MLFGVPFSSDLQELIIGEPFNGSNGKKMLKSILDFMQEISIIVNDINSEDNKSLLDIPSQVDRSVSTFLASPEKKKLYFNIANNVVLISGQKPITTIKTVSGNSVPVYRLTSTGFEDTYYIEQYVQNAENKPLAK